MALTYRDMDTSGAELAVFSNELCIGHISKRVLSGPRSNVKWGWNFSITPGPPGFEYHGRADTLKDAKAAVERNWRAWLFAAGLAGQMDAPPL